MIETLGGSFHEEVSSVAVGDALSQHRSGDAEAHVADDVVKVASAMFDESGQASAVTVLVGHFQSQERGATPPRLDLRCEAEFAVESGIYRAPIGERHVAFARDAVDKEDGSAAFAAKSFSNGLGDKFVRDATGKTNQTNHARSGRTAAAAAVIRRGSKQSPAIPKRGRNICQSIHFRRAGCDGELPVRHRISAYRRYNS